MGLTLRKKLLLGFGGMLVIALVLSTVGWELMRKIEQALAGIELEHRTQLRACEEIDSDLMRLEKYFHGDANAAMSAEATAIGSRVDRAIESMLEDGHHKPAPEDVRKLQDAWGDFGAAWKAYVEAADEAERQLVYRERLTPSTARVGWHLNALRRDATRSVIATAQRASEVARTTREWLFLLALGAVLLTAMLLAGVGQWILKPLRQIHRSVDKIERGEMDGLHLPTQADEIGALGAAIERMAQALREYRRSDAARFERTRQTTQLAIESLPSAVAIMSPEGKIEIANDAARRLFGLQPGMEVGDIRDKWLAEMFAGVLANPRRIEPKGYESAVQVFDATGERFFLPQMFPILDGTSRPAGVTVVLVDVTQLRKIDEARSGLISMVSHELKTPLTSIQMCIHLMLDSAAELPAKQRELLEAAREDSDRLGQIIESLLDMGRLQAGRAKLELATASVADLIADSMGPLEGLVASGALTLDLRLPEGLPAVLADRARIRHAIGNVLSNAAKYTPTGGRITIDAEADAEMVHVRISDTGIGIPAEYLPNIFEKFVRTPGGTEVNAEGMGLGLAIAREVIEAHGGMIRAASAEGSGSTFTVSLRRADAGDGTDDRR